MMSSNRLSSIGVRRGAAKNAVEIARMSSCRRCGDGSRASCLSVSNDTDIVILVRSENALESRRFH